MRQDSRGTIGIAASLVTILGFFGLRTVYDLFPEDGSVAGHIEVPANPITTETGNSVTPSPSPLPLETPEFTRPPGVPVEAVGRENRRIPFLGNEDAPQVVEATTFSLLPRTSTGCLRVPEGFTHFSVDGLPPVRILIFIQCTDGADGLAVTRRSPVQPSSVRFENRSDSEVGFIRVTPY